MKNLKLIIVIIALLFGNIVFSQPKVDDVPKLNLLQIIMAIEPGPVRTSSGHIPMNIKEVFSNTTDMNNKLYFPLGQSVSMNPALIPVFVDWVKIELRQSDFRKAGTIFIAGILTSNREVVDPVTMETMLPFYTINSYRYIQVTQSNSLSVFSPLQAFSGNVKTWNFTLGLHMYFRNSTSEPEPAVNVNGVWSLWSGDVTQDNIVEVEDVVLWKNYQGTTTGYSRVDCDFNGEIDGSDLLYIDNNTNRISNRVPYPN